jgi:hypothetical protein
MKITKKEFDKFTKVMWERLEMGRKKYGDSFEDDDIIKEMISEATDLSNYALMLFLKSKKFAKKYKKKP